ncbi:MAG: arylsulfatase [Candidatus Hydrogenedentota bacterium]
MKKFITLLLLTIVAIPVSAEMRAPLDRPNIIYILADDLGYAELGSYGQKIIKTPNIDRIAAEGIRFTNHYSGQAVCAPSRCALMTGKHMGHTYIRDNGNPPGRETDQDRSIFPGQNAIPDETVTIAELLKDRGYATAAYGKWGLGFEGSSGDPLKQGFDDFGGFLCQVHAHNHYPRFLWKSGEQLPMPGNDRTLTGEQFSQDYFTKWGLDFIQENKDEPFFLYLPIAIPHLSIQVTDESLAQYKGIIPEEDYVHKGYLKHPYPRAGYAAMISHVDRDVGKIMDLVESLGLDNNTIIIFTSDNGPAFNRLGGSDSEFFESAGVFRGLKGSLYEGGIRVPLVARWPEQIEAGRTSDHISAFWDVLPTFTELTGATTPKNIDGISFARHLLDASAKQKQHDYLYWEFKAYGGQQAVRMGNWKGIRQNMLLRNGKINPDGGRLELYNLDNDPSESNDVADENRKVRKNIERVMREARISSDLFPFAGLDD